MKMLKKLVAVLFAALLIGGPLAPMAAYSQNFQQTQNLYGTGGLPQTNHNSAGTTWGQEGSPSANTWSLGYSASGTGGVPPTTLATTYNMLWDNTPSLTAAAPFVLKQTQFGTGSGGVLGVYASSTVPVGSGSTSFVTMIGSNTAITLTSTPTISTMNALGTAIAGGTYVVLQTTASSILLQDNGTLSNSLLRTFNAANVTVSSNSSVSFMFNSIDGFWHQIAR